MPFFTLKKYINFYQGKNEKFLPYFFVPAILHFLCSQYRLKPNLYPEKPYLRHFTSYMLPLFFKIKETYLEPIFQIYKNKGYLIRQHFDNDFVGSFIAPLQILLQL